MDGDQMQLTIRSAGSNGDFVDLDPPSPSPKPELKKSGSDESLLRAPTRRLDSFAEDRGLTETVVCSGLKRRGLRG